jgi:DNA ligase (NAD+)
MSCFLEGEAMTIRRRAACAIVLALLLLTSAPPCPAASCPETPPARLRQQMDELARQIRHHDRLYYRDLAPVISDSAYDRLRERLVRLEECYPDLAASDSPTRQIGGGKAAAGEIVHQAPMLSLHSSPDSRAIRGLLRRLRTAGAEPELLVQPKVDGLPVEILYLDGRLVSAATRGDGRAGEDVTARVRSVAGIPERLAGKVPPRLAVRGEIYTDRQRLAEADDALRKAYASPRHLAAGTLQAEKPHPRALALLRFFPFELVNPPATIASDRAALDHLAMWGFPVEPQRTQSASSLRDVQQFYDDALDARRKQPFASDGIVVKVDDLALRRRLGADSRAPHWAAAWKFPPATACSTVRAIEWRIGRTGRRTPVAVIRPVELGGNRVSRVSLYNPDELDRLDIAPGDRVVVELSGDAVPGILRVTSRSDRLTNRPPQPPPTAPGIDACLQLVRGCRRRFLARAAHFVSRSGLNVEGLGPARLEAMAEQGLVKTLPDLFRLRTDQLMTAEGFGPKSARKLVAAIARASRPDTAHLLVALGVPGVGPATAGRLADYFGDLRKIMAADTEELQAVREVGKVTAGNLHSFFESPGGRELLAELRQEGLF